MPSPLEVSPLVRPVCCRPILPPGAAAGPSGGGAHRRRSVLDPDRHHVAAVALDRYVDVGAAVAGTGGDVVGGGRQLDGDLAVAGGDVHPVGHGGEAQLHRAVAAARPDRAGTRAGGGDLAVVAGQRQVAGAVLDLHRAVGGGYVQRRADVLGLHLAVPGPYRHRETARDQHLVPYRAGADHPRAVRAQRQRGARQVPGGARRDAQHGAPAEPPGDLHLAHVGGLHHQRPLGGLDGQPLAGEGEGAVLGGPPVRHGVATPGERQPEHRREQWCAKAHPDAVCAGHDSVLRKQLVLGGTPRTAVQPDATAPAPHPGTPLPPARGWGLPPPPGSICGAGGMTR
ncbi:protein of unknown function [Streptantibioticus cattleyicolor NRRL 8057 = DSM 46488]|nr:protein of unknown function [Streptantibioticus cattleyicolor NRRL 8057 = DSM 46488]